MYFEKNEYVFPKKLSDALAKFHFDSESPGSKKISSSTETLKKLWQTLAVGRGQIKSDETHYSFDRQNAKLYSAYYLTANCLKSYFILKELRLLYGKNTNGEFYFDPTVFLDLGCGPGSAGIGIQVWNEENENKKNFRYIGVDHSKTFLQMGRELFDFLATSTFKNFESHEWLKTKFIQKEWADIFFEKKPDVVFLMNMVAEIEADIEKRKKTILEMVRKLHQIALDKKQTKWFILVEPASKNSSRELLEVREYLIENSKGIVRTPCMSDRKCGAYVNKVDWCHEEVACVFPDWHNELGEGAGLKKEAMLFSYLVVEVGERFSDLKWNESAIRVVSQRMKEKGLTKCWACTPEAKKQFRILDSKVTEKNKDFLSVGRGELFTSIEADEKGSVLSFEKCTEY